MDLGLGTDCFLQQRFVQTLLYQRFQHLPYGLLVGPSYAEEVVANKYTCLTIASQYSDIISIVRDTFDCTLYQTESVKTIGWLSISKNSLTLICGLMDGFSAGKNATTALIVDYMNQLSSLDDFDTGCLLQHAGIGDLYLTCSSKKSRNYRYGSNFAQAILANYEIQCCGTVEGIDSLEYITSLLELPILSTIEHVFASRTVAFLQKYGVYVKSIPYDFFHYI